MDNVLFVSAFGLRLRSRPVTRLPRGCAGAEHPRGRVVRACSAQPCGPRFGGERERKKTLNSSLLTAKSNYLVGFQAEGDQNGEAALNLSREAVLDESWRSGGGNYL